MSTPAQHVPAWKKLGLKLKQPGGGAGPASEPANGSTGVGQPSGSTGHKRKIDAPPSSDASPYKKFRGDDQHSTPDGILSSSSKPKKSVKFGATPTKNDAVSPATARTNNTTPTGKPKKETPKKPKGPAKKKKEAAPTDLKPALEYLRQWKTARENWKFNKNHQSTLIKHIFDKDGIPSSDIDVLYEYLQDLKGFVRTRLREEAMEVQMQDVADGSAAFPDDMMDLDDKQEQYDAILADILRRKREQGGPKRKFFNETQYVAESQDGEVVIRRVVKRMRAEIVMDDLSDGESTDATSTTMSSKTVTNSDNNATITTNGDKQQPQLSNTTAKRRRKLRTNMDDSSSSESESDSDSDTSSSGSSDSEDEEGGQQDDDDTSSSSSSSSSEGEESGSDDSDED